MITLDELRQVVANKVAPRSPEGAFLFASIEFLCKQIDDLKREIESVKDDARASRESLQEQIDDQKGGAR